MGLEWGEGEALKFNKIKFLVILTPSVSFWPPCSPNPTLNFYFLAFSTFWCYSQQIGPKILKFEQKMSVPQIFL